MNFTLTTLKTLCFHYYDQLNRLKSSQNYLTASSNLSDINTYATNKYNESFSYDANGNILNLERYNQTPSVMDNFSYNYYGMSNRLNWVDDPTSSSVSTVDMDDQSVNNYSYDEIGQLTADVQEGLTGITWNVRNKVTQVDKSGIHDVDFEYDEMGQRVMKRSRENNEDNWVETWYVRDAQGNTIATYEHGYTNKTGNAYNEHFRLNEHHIYGSSRLGIKNYSGYDLYSKNFNYAVSFLADGSFDKNAITDEALVTLNWENYKLNQRKLGDKQYEIGNHLGNVMEVVSDYKIPVPATTCTTGTQVAVDHYISDVLSYSDYYPFGAIMPGRSYNIGTYRYGFGNQEMDNEIKGAGNSLDYGERIFDPRLGRFLSVDPLTWKFAMLSPYQFASNSPIWMIDLDGLEGITMQMFQYYKANYHFITVQTAKGVEIQFSHVSMFSKKSKSDDVSINYFIDGMQMNKDQFAYYRNNASGAKDLYQAKKNSELVGNLFVNFALSMTGYGVVAEFGAAKGAMMIFAAETGKEVVANRGDLTQVDWFDVMVNTAAARFGGGTLAGEITAEMIDASGDFKADGKGFRLVFNKTKEGGQVFLDMTFGSFKTLVGGIAKETGASQLSEDQMKMMFDQMKTQISDEIKKREKQTDTGASSGGH